jgi:hypothetical protein
MVKYSLVFLFLFFFINPDLVAQDEKVLSFDELDAFTFNQYSLREMLDTKGNKEALFEMFKEEWPFNCTKDNSLPRLEWCEFTTSGLEVSFLAGMSFNLLEITSDEYAIDYMGMPITIGTSITELKEVLPKLEDAKESRMIGRELLGQGQVDVYVFWIGVKNSFTTLSFEVDMETEVITEISLYVSN